MNSLVELNSYSDVDIQSICTYIVRILSTESSDTVLEERLAKPFSLISTILLEGGKLRCSIDSFRFDDITWLHIWTALIW